MFLKDTMAVKINRRFGITALFTTWQLKYPEEGSNAETSSIYTAIKRLSKIFSQITFKFKRRCSVC